MLWCLLANAIYFEMSLALSKNGGCIVEEQREWSMAVDKPVATLMKCSTTTTVVRETVQAGLG
jgi:hypothetical protein